MTFEKLQRFSPLFTSAKRAGAATILNRSFGFDREQVLPLSISHGVDYGMCHSAMDVHGVEPVHWAYNSDIYQRALLVKRSVALPHPWWFVVRDLPVPVGSRTLVVGPPPGRTNDERLLALLRQWYDLSDTDILVKQRGDAAGSATFWRKNGVGVVTAGAQDDAFYPRLFDLLSGYALVVCCTFSSAAIFAASLGKKVVFLKGYSYLAYDVENCLDYVNLNSIRAKQMVSSFQRHEKDTVTGLARALLGFSTEHMSELKDRYLQAVSMVTAPTFNKSVLSVVGRELALVVGRPGLAQQTVSSLARRAFRAQQVVVKEVDEFSIWSEGVNGGNFSMRKVAYLKGVTEPGRAVDAY